MYNKKNVMGLLKTPRHMDVREIYDPINIFI